MAIKCVTDSLFLTLLQEFCWQTCYAFDYGPVMILHWLSRYVLCNTFDIMMYLLWGKYCGDNHANAPTELSADLKIQSIHKCSEHVLQNSINKEAISFCFSFLFSFLFAKRHSVVDQHYVTNKRKHILKITCIFGAR